MRHSNTADQLPFATTQCFILIGRQTVSVPVAQPEVLLSSRIARTSRRRNPGGRSCAVLENKVSGFVNHPHDESREVISVVGLASQHRNLIPAQCLQDRQNRLVSYLHVAHLADLRSQTPVVIVGFILLAVGTAAR